MRMDQYVGLTDRAKKWLDENATRLEWVKTVTYSDGRQETFQGSVIEWEAYGVIRGAWNDEVAALRRYTLKDGSRLEEFVLAQPWSSGPMYFIGLRPAPDSPANSLASVAPCDELNWHEWEIQREL